MVEDNIEEDIVNPYADNLGDQADDDGDSEYELYQAPISGGIPLRLNYAIDSSGKQRPFTPPFQ